MSTPSVRGPRGVDPSADPATSSSTASDVAPPSEVAKAARPADILEAPRLLRDESSVKTPVTEPAPLAPSPSVVRERPTDAAVLAKVFSVLDKLFQDPAFVAALGALAALPRVGQLAGALATSLALLVFLQNWLVRGRLGDPWLLGGALAAFVATLAHGGPIAPLAAATAAASWLARGKRKRRSRSLPLLDDGELDLDSWTDLYGELSGEGSLRASLGDEDTFAAWCEQAETALAYRAALARRPECNAAEQERLAALNRLFDELLPQQALAEAARLGFGIADVKLRESPEAGRLVHLVRGCSLAELTDQIAALSSFGQINKLHIGAALSAYNGLAPEEPLRPGTVLYVPTVAQTAPLPRGLTTAFLPPATLAEERRHLVEALPLVGAGRADGLASQAVRLIEVLDRMPMPPRAYELAATPEPQPA